MKTAVETRIDNGKTIEQIGQELCSGVKHPERKIIRIIKEIEGKGEPYLIENAEGLGFKGVTQLQKAIEKRESGEISPKRKIVQNSGLQEKPLNEQTKELVKKYQDEDSENWKANLLKCIDDFETEFSQEE
jgi:transposase